MSTVNLTSTRASASLRSLAMLQRLKVQNLAIVDTVELELGPGLNVLTGETGAGKSILVTALELVLGGKCLANKASSGRLGNSRGRADLVRTGASAAGVEA